MKHTYLYPLKEGERWLWRAGRMDGADLFSSPDTDAPDVEWSLSVGIADAVGAARNQLHERLHERERICVGRHYVIPGSLCEVAQERAREADQAVHRITEAFWDAQHLDGIPYANAYSWLKKVAGQGGRDDWKAIRNFLVAYRRWRVIPVWM
ncbi:hypothetical protein [Streptomyces cucumeris]|uniref:hypothetical protein n=1 Tax=Streptomyces cucumeris TaxID=2962890 RepID=UPI0020C878A5|nr:hypothetical protein [Streptomyces sp. NEAU-Y11]MCP9209550.1 hypothetical protein [Streptomyces sp. NEAU-Y11]